jgi:hypothetical protein
VHTKLLKPERAQRTTHGFCALFGNTEVLKQALDGRGQDVVGGSLAVRGGGDSQATAGAGAEGRRWGVWEGVA